MIGPVGTQRLVDRTLAMLEDDIGYRLEHHADLTEPPEVLVTEVSDGPVDLGVEGPVAAAAPTEHAPVRPTVGYRFEAEGAVAAVVGDTDPYDGLDRLTQGADVHVQTTVRRDLIETSGIPRLVDVLDYQSTIEQAADTATRQGVGTRVLPPGADPGGRLRGRGRVGGAGHRGLRRRGRGRPGPHDDRARNC